MFRKKLSILAMVVLLVLAVALVGCSDKDKKSSMPRLKQPVIRERSKTGARSSSSK